MDRGAWRATVSGVAKSQTGQHACAQGLLPSLSVLGHALPVLPPSGDPDHLRREGAPGHYALLRLELLYLSTSCHHWAKENSQRPKWPHSSTRASSGFGCLTAALLLTIRVHYPFFVTDLSSGLLDTGHKGPKRLRQQL